MKRLFYLWFMMVCALISFPLSSQTLSEIQNPQRFICGIGQGVTVAEADQHALEQLVSQISVRVESSFEMIVQEAGDSLKQFSNSAVRSYSNVTLQQNRSRILSDEPGEAKVIRFIEIEELERMFADRKSKIIDLVKSGWEASRQNRPGDAIRNYYWALVLLRSHPEVNSIEVPSPPFDKALLITRLPGLIDQVFDQLEFTILKTVAPNATSPALVTLSVYYQGKPAENLDFVYWTGDSYSPLISTTDGVASIEFQHAQPVIKINIEYAYRHKARWDAELESLLATMPLPSFSRSRIRVEADTDKSIEKGIASDIQNTPTDGFAQGTKVEGRFLTALELLKESITVGDVSLVRHLFNDEGYDLFSRLFIGGRMQVVPGLNDPLLFPVAGGWELRGLGVRFAYNGAYGNFIEYLTFCFDTTGVIAHLSFSLNQATLEGIARKSNRFGSESDKKLLISFIEDFKTAYSLRRLDFLKQVFADNALIIVGRIVKPGGSIEGMYQSLGSEAQYVTLTKTEYLNRLQKVFSSNEFVRLQFESTNLTKINGASKVYGLQLEQHYTSSSYADKGYLFLMIDLNDSLQPKIYVRTWQPQKNADGSIFGLEDFKM